MGTPAQLHRGECLCGAVRYEVAGQPIIVAHCHCEACQRGSGAGHSTGAMFSIKGFALTGEISEYCYQSDNGNRVTRAFCPTCGSPLFGKNSAMKAFVTLTLGTLNNSSDFEPQVVVFTKNKKSWDLIDETLALYEEQPDWKPDDGL